MGAGVGEGVGAGAGAAVGGGAGANVGRGVAAGAAATGAGAGAGDKVTVVLNGVKIHDNVKVDRATGSELDTKVNEPGAFFLQGDHGAVSFRNLRVKELPKE